MDNKPQNNLPQSSSTWSVPTLRVISSQLTYSGGQGIPEDDDGVASN